MILINKYITPKLFSIGGINLSLIIGIDYGTGQDIPMYTASLKQNGKLHIINIGKIDDFDYQKFVASKYQIKFVGEPGDLKRFKANIFNDN